MRTAASARSPDLASVVPTDDVSYYNGVRYWNALPAVRAYQDRLALGEHAAKGIWQFALDRYERDTFERALVLNCGNGWVERVLVQGGVIQQAVGVDVSAALIAEATGAADNASLPLTYHQLDINTAELPSGPFDLVINYAAAHHITYLDRVFRRLERLLGPDGVLFCWDYCGPSRNQYPLETWLAIWELNQQLPEPYRKQLRYPHLNTMLAIDPTEAVHSDLVIEHIRRYFSIDYMNPTGGLLAYEILTENPGCHQPGDRSDAVINQVLAADEASVNERGMDGSLFYFALALPASVPRDEDVLYAWTEQEEQREQVAHANGGRYGPVTFLEDVYGWLYDEMIAATHARSAIDELQTKLFQTDIRARARNLLRSFPGVQPLARAARLRRGAPPVH
jgi:SAM-dependent methyltransferase